MYNFLKNNNYLKVSLYAIFVVIVSILFYRISSNTDNIAPSIMAFIDGIIDIIEPILYGLLIAYLFNPIMIFFETYIKKWFKPSSKRSQGVTRSISILLVYIFIIGTIILMFQYLVPQISKNLGELSLALPDYAKSLEVKITQVENSINQSIEGLPYMLDTSKIFDMIDPAKYLNTDFIGNIMTNLLNHAASIMSSLFNWLMGLVIAFYVLQQKEAFAKGTKRLCYTLFSTKFSDKTISIFSEGHQIFIKFFVGKFVVSFIIGVLCLIGLTLLDNPYALLLSVIVGVLNMIPYFGPFLGAIPAVLITLFTGFMPAVMVAIFILILQQFDGLVLGPKILGDSIGLSPFWIISGILIGGAIWGPLGMFFASPIIAVLLKNLDRYMDKILKQKQIKL